MYVYSDLVLFCVCVCAPLTHVRMSSCFIVFQRQLQCAYLARLLDEATGLRTHASGDGWVAIDCTSLLDRPFEWDEEEEEEEEDSEV